MKINLERPSCFKYRGITVETLISNLLIANITQPKHYTNKALGPLGHARLVRYLFRLFIIILYILNIQCNVEFYK